MFSHETESNVPYVLLCLYQLSSDRCHVISVVPRSLDAGAGRGNVDPIAASGASTLAEETGVQTVPVVPAGTGTIITEPGVEVVPVIPERPAITMDPATHSAAGPAPMVPTLPVEPVTPPVTPAAADLISAHTISADLPFVPDASQVIDPAAPVVPITPISPTTRVALQQPANPVPTADVGPPFQVNLTEIKAPARNHLILNHLPFLSYFKVNMNDIKVGKPCP